MSINVVLQNDNPTTQDYTLLGNIFIVPDSNNQRVGEQQFLDPQLTSPLVPIARLTVSHNTVIINITPLSPYRALGEEQRHLPHLVYSIL